MPRLGERAGACCTSLAAEKLDGGGVCDALRLRILKESVARRFGGVGIVDGSAGLCFVNFRDGIDAVRFGRSSGVVDVLLYEVTVSGREVRVLGADDVLALGLDTGPLCRLVLIKEDEYGKCENEGGMSDTKGKGGPVGGGFLSLFLGGLGAG